MKTEPKNRSQLIEAARLALQSPALTQFWDEVEQRMERRESSKKGLVEPRKTRTV